MSPDSDPHNDAADKPLILILAINGLDFDRRVANEAKSLSEVGFSVIRVGVRTAPHHELREVTEFDTIVRMAPAWYVPPPASDGSVEVAQISRFRRWKWKVAFMDGLRRSMPGTMKSLDALRDWVRWNRELIKTCSPYRPAVVVATDFDTLLAGYSIKRRTGCFLVYDAHELWLDMHNRMYLTRVFRQLFLVIKGFLVRRADMRMTVSGGLAQVLSKRYSVDRPLIVFNGPDEIVSPQQHGPRKLAVYFQGLLQSGRGLEASIDAMVDLKGRATLTIQGFGELEEELKGRAAGLGLDDGTVSFLSACSPDDVSACASGYDVGLISVEPICLNNILSMPNKIFSYLGGSLALITTAEAPEIAATVEQNGCGVVIESWSAPLIYDALLALADQPEVVERMRANAKKAAERLAWDRQFQPVLQQLSSENAPVRNTHGVPKGSR